LILACFFIGSKINIVLSQKESSFSGELTYSITKISSDKLENDFSLGDVAVEEKMIIYAKDSLVKRVHFSSVNGIQESRSCFSYEKQLHIQEKMFSKEKNRRHKRLSYGFISQNVKQRSSYLVQQNNTRKVQQGIPIL